jgi:hypothetical protein
MTITRDDLPVGLECRLHVRLGDRDYEYPTRIKGFIDTPRGLAVEVMQVEKFDRRFVGSASRVFRLADIVAVGEIAGPSLIKSAAAKEAHARRNGTRDTSRKRSSKQAARPAPKRRDTSRTSVDDDGLMTLSIAGRAFRVLAKKPPVKLKPVVEGATFTQRGRWGGGTYTVRIERHVAERLADWFSKSADELAHRKEREQRNDMRSCRDAAIKIREVLP